jgi:glycerate 2-kinase
VWVMQLTRSDVLSAYAAALAAVDPRAAVDRSVSLKGSTLTIGDHTFGDVAASDVVVVAIGKAAPAMAAGAHGVVGHGRGFVVSAHSADVPYPMCVGSHPLPDASSFRCGRSLVDFVQQTKPSDVVVFLVSGGGSAAASLPVDGVAVEDLAEMNSELLASGLPIEDINEIRAATSQIKGGLLGAATTAQRQVTLILSDVVGAGPEHVASGPSIGFGLGSRARSVLAESGLRAKMSSAVVRAVDEFVRPEVPEVLMHTTIGSPSIAAHAAVADLRSSGFDASVATTELVGEAREEAVALAVVTACGTVAVAAGETTVSIRGAGSGGRNQEAALAVAMASEGQDVLFAALGTDGIDGPTPAAGAVIDGMTAIRAKELGIDLSAALEDNDSHSALTALGETVVTGPSGTNVADLWIAAKGPF